MHKVPFLTVEDEVPDLIVSFALGVSAERSLTLLRTPAFESILDDWERGVTVGVGAQSSPERELLLSIQWADDRVVVKSSKNEYVLDVSSVDIEEVDAAKKLLHKMNFDSRFLIIAA